MITALGGTINGATGAYTAAAIAGTEIVRVTDKVGAVSDAVVTVTGGSPNYAVASATFPGSGAGNTGFAGDFVVSNISTDTGMAPVRWRLYRSSDPTVDPGDTIVATGTIGPLPGLGSTGPVPFAGTRPSTGGPWRLIVEIAADDDAGAANNQLASGPIPVTDAPPADVDYAVAAVSSTGDTIAGAALNGQFTLQNTGSSNGSRTVFWEVYVSANATLDGSDLITATGSLAALPAFGAAGPILFSGAWPAAPGSYYLIVHLIAEDDINAGNNDGATGSSVTTTQPDVNYQVNSVLNVGAALTNSALHGRFQLQNVGTRNGAATVNWTAYRSLDNTLEIGTDIVVDAGSTTALNASASTLIDFYGTWPPASGTWYLIVRLQAADDTVSANNVLASASVSVTVPSVDYAALSVTYVSGYTLPTGAVNGTFTFKNNGADAGTQPVSYLVYASLDATLDPTTDSVVSAGTTSSLAGGATLAPVPFSGTWPLAFGNYYLIVRLSCAQDPNALNDTAASATPVAVGILVEGEPNNNCVTFVDADDLLNTSVTGVRLRPGMSLKVTGTMGSADLDDVFKIDTGTAASVTTAWTVSNTNESMGIFYYKPSPATILFGYSVGSVPGGSLSMTWAVDQPNAVRYIDLYNANSKNLGAYTCIITAQ